MAQKPPVMNRLSLAVRICLLIWPMADEANGVNLAVQSFTCMVACIRPSVQWPKDNVQKPLAQCYIKLKKHLLPMQRW